MKLNFFSPCCVILSIFEPEDTHLNLLSTDIFVQKFQFMVKSLIPLPTLRQSYRILEIMAMSTAPQPTTETKTTSFTSSMADNSDTTTSYPESNDESSNTMSLKTLTALTRFYGGISITSFLFGLLLNILVFGYFYSRRKTLSNTLYSVIVVVDMLISLLIFPYIFPHFSKLRAPFLFSSQDFCKFWTVIWGAGSKTTVVLVGFLGVYRTILLLWPLNSDIRALKKRHVLGCVFLYFLLLLLCETVPLWQEYHWYFDQLRMRCEWFDLNGCGETCKRVRTFNYVWNTITLAVPVLPVLMSAGLSVYGLRRGEKGGDEGKKYASMTIVLFTLLYVVLNIPTLIYWIMMLVHWRSDYTSSLMKFDQPYYFYSNFVEVISVALNSLLNPVLYLYRMRELRSHVTSYVGVLMKFARQSTVRGREATRSTDLNSGQRNMSSAKENGGDVPLGKINNVYQ